jgi:hypothetical protein
VADEAVPASERACTAEVVAALCLATDLSLGFPFEHGLHAPQIAMIDRALAAMGAFADLVSP